MNDATFRIREQAGRTDWRKRLSKQVLRLSYHGLRPKNNSFIATMQKEFDSSKGKFNNILYGIGKVLPNS
jgi:hypothetical protein